MSPEPGDLYSELVEKWRREASEQGSVPQGSLAKAQVYRDCADELEEAIESTSDDVEHKSKLKGLFQ